MELSKTLGELKKSGYCVLTVHEEMRINLVRHLETGEGSNVMKLLKTLVRRFAAITEERPAADQLSARPV